MTQEERLAALLRIDWGLPDSTPNRIAARLIAAHVRVGPDEGLRKFGEWIEAETAKAEKGREPRYRAARIGLRVARAKWRAIERSAE